MPCKVLTVEDVAPGLGLAEMTVCAMTNNSEILAFKTHGQRRIRRADFDTRMKQQSKHTNDGDEDDR